MNDEDVIYWNKNKKLTWDDFKGTPDPNNPHAASSSVGFEYAYECENNIRKTKVICGFKNIKAEAIFIPSKSWVRKERIPDEHSSTVLLNHEQGHFDLAKESSKQVQEKIMERLRNVTFSFMGKSKEQLEKNQEKRRRKLTKPIEQELKKEHKEVIQKRYEEETDHGKVETKQNEYDERFSKLRQ